MLELIILTILISVSGALSPGPLTVSTAALGLRKGYKAGILAAMGHMIFELPFVFILCLFYSIVASILLNSFFKLGFTAFLLIFITFFASLLLKDAIRGVEIEKMGNPRIENPLLIGLIFTAANPYFLLWWATVGFPLIQLVINNGFPFSFAIMYSSHIWLDYAWLTMIASLTSVSKKFMKGKGFRIISLSLAIFLYYLAASIISFEFFNVKILF